MNSHTRDSRNRLGLFEGMNGPQRQKHSEHEKNGWGCDQRGGQEKVMGGTY